MIGVCCSCVCSVPKKVSASASEACVVTEHLCTEGPCRGPRFYPEAAQMLHPFLHFVLTRLNARLVLGPAVWRWGLRWLCCLLETGLPRGQDSPRTCLLRSSSRLWCEVGGTGILHLERDPSKLPPRGCLQSTWHSVIQPTTQCVHNKAAAAGPTPTVGTLIMGLHTIHTHTTCSLTKPATRVAPCCEHAYKEAPMTEPGQLVQVLTMAAQTTLQTLQAACTARPSPLSESFH